MSANIINYQSQSWNVLSNLEPQLNQLNNKSPLGRKESAPAQAAWELDEDELLVTACLHYGDTTQ